jgi:hypothetical protein
MKRFLMGCAVAVSGFLLLGLPKNATACSRCDPSAPRCQTANYSRCSTYAYSKTVTICEEQYAQCAWVYAPSEVSADGSLATLALAAPENVTRAQVRGCHGLIVDRAYAIDRQTDARASSREIVL